MKISDEMVRRLNRLYAAQEFLARAKADPTGAEVGAVRDGQEWVEEAARAVTEQWGAEVPR